MNNGVIITIARQYGSGGREIGARVAKLLGIDYFDKELITLAAEKGGYNKSLLENADERAGSGLMYSLISGFHPAAVQAEPSFNDRVFMTQANVIREIAEKSSGVIVGRCADYILRDHERLFRVFIRAEQADRERRAVEAYGMPRERIADAVTKMDKKRASYYNFYTSRRWGEINNYDIVLNSSKFGMERCAEAIAALVK